MSTLEFHDEEHGTIVWRGNMKQLAKANNVIQAVSAYLQEQKYPTITGNQLADYEFAPKADPLEPIAPIGTVKGYEQLIAKLFEIMEPVFNSEEIVDLGMVDSWVSALVKKCQAQPKPDYAVEVGSFAWAVDQYNQGVPMKVRGRNDVLLNPNGFASSPLERELRAVIAAPWMKVVFA